MKKRFLWSLPVLGLGLLLALPSIAESNQVVKKEEGHLVKVLTTEEVEKNNEIRFKPLYKPADAYYNTQKMALGNVGNIESVWDNYKGAGTKIAIIDTGINYKHPDFQRADGSYAISDHSKYFYVSSNTVRSKTAATDGWDVLMHEWDYDYNEWDAHGTSVAGTSAATSVNGVGTIGIAPEAEIYAYKIDMSFAAINAAIADAIKEGVDVINMSLGAYAESFYDGFGEWQSGSSSVATALATAINNAYKAGIIVVAAAGNELTDRRSYPACNDHVIGVGALAKSSSTEASSYSNYNSSSDTATNNHNVDIAAPGTVYAPTEGGTRTSIHYTDYCEINGTSFASPIVAGAACLWKQKHANGTPNQFEQDLYASAFDIGAKGFDAKFGYGRLDIAALMEQGTDSITLDRETMSLPKTMSQTIGVVYSSGTVQWSSSKPTVATVDSSGKVTGISTGTSVITAKCGEASASVTVTVTEYVPVSEIVLGEGSATIPEGANYTIPASVLPENATDKTLLFESDNEGVATVNDDGVIHGVSAGQAEIFIMGADDSEAYFTVTVTTSSDNKFEKVTSVLQDYSGTYLLVCESSSLAFNGAAPTLDAANNSISVSIANQSIAASTATMSSAVTLAKRGSGYTVQTTTGKYIYGTSSTNVLNSTTSVSDSVINTVTFASSSATLYAPTVFTYNTSATRFRYMKNAMSPVTMYKLVSSSAPEKILDSISVAYSGGNVVQGGQLDQSKITVTAHYTDSYYRDETVTGWTLSGFDSATVGTKNVTVTFQGKTANFSVNVIEDPTPVLQSITIENMPKTVQYRSEFIKTGIKVIAHYNKGGADVDVTTSVDIPDIDTTKIGENSIEVSYTESGVTKSSCASTYVTCEGALPEIAPGETSWSLVTNVNQLQAGDRIVIYAQYANYALGVQSGSSRKAISASKPTSTTAPIETASRLTVKEGAIDGTFALFDGTGYLAPTTSADKLTLENSVSVNSSFSMSFDSSNGRAIITSKGTSSYKYLKYVSKSAGFAFRSGASEHIVCYKETVESSVASWTGADQAKDYATFFLESTATGCASQSLDALSGVWAELLAQYGAMIPDAKTAFVSGTDAKIVEARLRYANIVAKYKLDSFVVDGRGNAYLTSSLDGEKRSAAVLVGLATCGVILAVSLFIKNRRKEA